jgi:hypothetical protein
MLYPLWPSASSSLRLLMSRLLLPRSGLLMLLSSKVGLAMRPSLSATRAGAAHTGSESNNWSLARLVSVETKSPVQYRAGRWRLRQGRLGWALASSVDSARTSVQNMSVGEASHQLTTQMPSKRMQSIQSLGLSSSSSSGVGSCRERPLGPWCLLAGTCASLKSKRRMTAI